MPILDILQSIYTIGKSIYDTAQAAEANKTQCQRLAERVTIIVTSVKSLESVKDSDHYLDGLTSLKKILQDCLAFIQEFSCQGWFKKVFKNGSSKEKFTELNEALAKAIQTVILGFNAQQIINREQDSKDQATDNEYLRKNQERILELNVQAKKVLEDIKLGQEDQKVVMGNFFQSMRNHMQALRVPNTESKQTIPQDLIVPYFELEFHEKLAEGSFGKVYLGKWSEQIVAIKSISEIDEKAMEEFTREVGIMGRLRHENIVHLYAVCIEQEHPCLVMEYMSKGSLYKVLEDTKLTAEQQKQIALDIAKGLAYLHQKKVLHRDLKSGNILLSSGLQAKITDFGLSKMKGNLCIKTIKKDSLAIEWQAPESLKRGYTYDESADIYSYGVILSEIVTGRKPLADCQEDHLQAVLAGKHDEIPNTVPEIYRRLIQSCLDSDPKKRPTVKIIIQTLTDYIPTPTVSAEEYYQRGIQLEKEQKLPQAREQYEESAKLGFARAMTNIGFFFLNGLAGLKPNKVKAYENFLAAAQKGHARAMVNLATMLERGDGTKRNLSEALKWYESAVKAGDIKSQAKCEELTKALQEERKAMAKQTSPKSSAPSSSSAQTSLSATAAIQTVQNMGQMKS